MARKSVTKKPTRKPVANAAGPGMTTATPDVEPGVHVIAGLGRIKFDEENLVIRRLDKPMPTKEELTKLANPTTEWEPFRYDSVSTTVQLKEAMAKYEVADRNLPVEVHRKDGSTLARYDNMDAFDTAHDKKTYPVHRAISAKEMTVIIVDAKPWADAPPKPKAEPRQPKVYAAPEPKAKPPKLKKGEKPQPKRGRQPKADGGKAGEIAKLLLRKEGCTRDEILKLTGWVSVSVQAQARQAGIGLRIEGQRGNLRYYGVKP